MVQEFAGDYSLQRRLALGRSWDLSVATSPDGRTVWVKRAFDVSTSDDESWEHRRSESGLTNRHPLVIEPVDKGLGPAGAFWVYVPPPDARSLAELLEKGERLEPRQACRWAVAAAEVVEALTEVEPQLSGFLQPASVVLGAAGDAVAIIMDRCSGPLRFQAPEQLKGATPDTRSDVFTLGALLYQATTGAHPYGYVGPDDVEPADLLETPTPSPSSLDPGFPSGLEKVVMTAITRDPWVRYQRLSDLIRDLRACVGHDAPASESSGQRFAEPATMGSEGRVYGGEALGPSRQSVSPPRDAHTGHRSAASSSGAAKSSQPTPPQQVLSFSRDAASRPPSAWGGLTTTLGVLAAVGTLTVAVAMALDDEPAPALSSGGGLRSDGEGPGADSPDASNPPEESSINAPPIPVVVAIRPRSVNDNVIGKLKRNGNGASVPATSLTGDAAIGAVTPDLTPQDVQSATAPPPPVSGRGTLTVTANVRGAKVVANGIPIGRTPVQGVALSAGPYKVEVIAGAARWSGRSVVRSNGDVRVHAALDACRIFVVAPDERGTTACTLDGRAIAVRGRSPIFATPGSRIVRCEAPDGTLLLERRFAAKPGGVHRFVIEAPKPD